MRGRTPKAATGEREVGRRAVLAGAAGVLGSLAGCSRSGSGGPPVSTVAGDRARTLAERFAPTVYFDRRERWFPTDPRPYESERDGETVVDGFDALEGYVRRFGGDRPPDPAVFYHAVEYGASPLAAVQFWFYAPFDQFTTNFHWHDWELLQVFVDTESDEPQLYVASAHSRAVPNNEFLDPERRPRVLAELGSHSSGLSVNDDPDGFQRLAGEGAVADITNSALEGVEALAGLPLAYGLPRDEGRPLPYVVPELDGEPLYRHERLPSVGRSDLVPPELTIRSLDALGSPPADLPRRETGRVFDHGDGEKDAVAYDLIPTAELEHIAAFIGPQLSFEFAIPRIAEDAVAKHISTASAPWEDPRYAAPTRDITDPSHRRALAKRYDVIGEPSATNRVIAAVTNAVAAEDAPDGEGLATVPSPVETIALLESEARAVPTFRGAVVVDGVPAGEHTLTVNGAGVAPHSETVAVEGTTTAGVDGEIPTVARDRAVKLTLDPGGAEADLTRLAVADDFAGRLYDAPLSGPDAIYVHRGGAFTAEVRDREDAVGAFRVTPDGGERIRIENPGTGKAPLATYIADVAAETRADVAAIAEAGAGGRKSAVRGLARALGAVAEAAGRAAERAAAGDRANANRSLEAVATRLDRVGSRLAAARDSLPQEWAKATANRLEQARRRSSQARAARKL